MIGTKKLSTICTEIIEALSSNGEDPIRHLGESIAGAKRNGDRTELLEGLKQFLESSPQRKGRRRSVAAKK